MLKRIPIVLAVGVGIGFSTPVYSQAVLVDLAKEFSNTVGTGTLTVTGAVTGYVTFENAATQVGVTIDDQTVSYGIVDGNFRESGRGVYDADTNTLTRCATDCTSTDGDGTPISLTGTSNVGITAIHQDFSDRQPADADLTSWAAIVRAAGFDTFVTTPTSANLGALVTDDAFLLSDTDLGSWASVTRAAGFDTFAATPTMANLGSVLTNEAAGWITFGTTPSSANLATLVTDETGSGALVFGTAPDLTISPTTEANIETAIDTLANLTSIQTFTVTLVDAGVDAVFGWDEPENVYQNLTAGEVLAVIEASTPLLTEAEATAAYQPLDTDLTSWALVTRAAGYDTFATTPTSANLAALVTNETGSGALVFGTAPDITISVATEGNIETAIDSLVNLTVWGTADNSAAWLDATELGLDDGTVLRLYEPEAGGDNYLGFVAPATITANGLCTLQDSTTAPIPDSCVGNGVDDTGAAGTVTAVGTPLDNQIAVWTTAATIEGDTAFTFDTATDALSISITGIFTTGSIELGHASANTLTASGGVLSIEGVALLTATSADALFLTPAEGNAAYQPLDADLTSWALITRTAAFDTLAAATANSAALRAYLSDEIGTGVLVFLGTPADDQVPVGDSASATTWRTIADSDAATQKLQYDQATNTFSAGTDDDVPEVGDFAALVGGSGIDNNSGTLDFDATEITTVTWGSSNFTTMVFSTDGVDFTWDYTTTDGVALLTGGGSSPTVALDDDPTLQFLEEDANGSNFLAFSPPATITTSQTCTFEDDASFIPDSCVGDGTDAGAGAVSASGTPVDNQVAVWTSASAIEGDTAFTFDTATDALSITITGVFTTGTIELGHASTNTLDVSGGALRLEGVALLTATSADALFLTPAEGNAAYQPLDADLTSWAGVTRAAGFDTFTTTPSSANLRSLLTDEIGTGVLVFLGTPADDQVPVGDSASATTWRTVADSDAATQKLQYDQATNTFSAGTDDDVPESGDFGGLTGGSGITVSSGTIDFAPTELATVTWGTANFTTMTFDAGATDTAFEFASGTFTVDIGGTNELTLTASAFSPGVDAGQTLGTTALAWNDLFLDTGATINIESGDWLATHTTGILTVTTGDLRVTTAGTNSASVVTVGGTQTLTAKTLTSPTINGATIDSTSTLAIGSVTEGNIETALDTLANVTSIGGDVTAGGDFTSTDDTFVGDDLSLTSTGALINIGAANDCVITHSADTLTLTGCTAVGFGAPTNYVATVADGTGIDGTATGAASTYTPTLDLTEITTATLGNSNFTTIVASTDGVDLTWDYTTTDGVATLSGGGTSPGVALDDQGFSRYLEEDASGSNYKSFQAPSTITADTTCTFEDDANFIPDSCVGDGSDDDVPESGDYVNLTGGTGITNTTGTLSVDGTELGTVTWGAAATITWTFDVGATDFVETFTNPGTVTYSASGTSPIINVDDAGALRILEEDAGGSNYFELVGPATLGANFTCTIDSATGRIPDSCVGDGTDGGGSQTPWTSDIDADQFSLLDFDSIEWGTGTDTTMVRSAPGDVSIENAVIKKAGRETIWVPAASMHNNASSPAACGNIYDSGTNDLTIMTCNFDTGATEERVDFGIWMPKMWNAGTVTAEIMWTTTTGTAAQTVQWAVSCVAVSNDDPLNVAMGTVQVISDTFTALNDAYMTGETPAITCAGTPAKEDYVQFRISRDTSADDMTGDAILIGAKIFVTTDASTDL